MNAHQTLFRRISAIIAKPRRSQLSLGPDLDVYGGLERRTQASSYRWDGLARGADEKRPYIVLQYTIDGIGEFRTNGRSQRQTPGSLFGAVVPSPHIYSLPKESSHWTFFWIMLHHPYLVNRIARAHPPAGPLLQVMPDSEVVNAMVEILAQHRQAADDRFSRERRLFDLLIALERIAWAVQHPDDRREQLLRRVRRIVNEQAMSRINVDDIAAAFSMSRSNFSHHFRQVTGMSPAMFVRDLRLESARDLLLHAEDSMKAIARATGFADTNHLCKAFRRRFGFTPGALRRQMREPLKEPLKAPSRAGE